MEDGGMEEGTKEMGGKGEGEMDAGGLEGLSKIEEAKM